MIYVTLLLVRGHSVSKACSGSIGHEVGIYPALEARGKRKSENLKETHADMQNSAKHYNFEALPESTGKSRVLMRSQNALK